MLAKAALRALLAIHYQKRIRSGYTFITDIRQRFPRPTTSAEEQGIVLPLLSS